MNLSELFERQPHHLTPVLNRFPRPGIAKRLGISPNFLSSILTGYNSPSPAMEKKMQTLVDQILDAEGEAKA